MKLHKLFQRDINRSITGVVKVEQTKAEEVFQELTEFVITKELRKHFYDFFKAYNHSLDTKTDEMGVWISGFFGSGKSHLLKMLSYLLENKDVEGLKTISFFEENLSDDSLLFNEMKRPTNFPTDVLLFNIESKAGSQDKAGKTAIVDIFMKMFNTLCGYCGETPWIAEIERLLVEEGTYDDFKKAYQEVADEEWEEGRHKVYFIRDLFIEALTRARKAMSKESAGLLFDNAENNYSMSCEKFALLVKKYLDSKGKDHRIIFLVDEMGQYIGDNSHLMLNLQTVTENLGIHCQGRAWVVVTSQEAIDELTKNRLKDQDFSKIQGRFKTRLNLSSSNTDEVIKKRLLLKEEKGVAKETLGLYYKDECASLRNLVSFSPNTAGMRSFENVDDFVETYPFIPYQFNLLQKVFECIRKFSHAGKHLAEGERSMLNAFHSALKDVGEYDIGTLVPFQAFYKTIESFLDSLIKRIFDKAEDNPDLSPFDVDVLKVLFMIKYVKEMPADIENLATLMITDMGEDKIDLRSKIDSTLSRLKAQTLICQNGELYDFLTDEEQDVEKGIRATKIDFDDVLLSLGKRIFEDVYPDKAYVYSKHNAYNFSRQVDKHLIGKPAEDLAILVVTPENNELLNEQAVKLRTTEMGKEGLLIIRLPDDRRYLDEIELCLKTEKYLKEKTAIKISDNVEKIHGYKRSELETRKGRVKSLLEEAIRQASFFTGGVKLSPDGAYSRIRIENALKTVTENAFHKLSFIDRHITSDSELHQILAGGNQTTFTAENKAALEDVCVFLTQKQDNHMKTTMKEMRDRYTRKPYGWNLYDIAGVVATLLARKEIKLEYNGESLRSEDNNIISCLTKEKEFEKVLIFKKEIIDSELIETGKSISKALFDCHNYPSEGDELVRVIRDHLMASEIKSLEGLRSHYEYTSRYPGKETVEQGIKLLTAIFKQNDTLAFLSALSENNEELQEWKKEVSPVKEFFKDTKKDIFKRALHCLSQYQKHQHILETDELIEICVNGLGEIVSLPKPWSSIKEIPQLEQRFKERYCIILLQKKEEEKKQVDEAWATVLSELKKHDLEADLSDELNKGFQELLEKINNAADIDSISDIKPRIESRLDKSLKQIEERLEKISQKTKETVKINPVKVAKGHVILETEEDVKGYISNLESALFEVIKAEKKILLSE